MRYDVTTDIYEGPLGLLVELSKLNLLDVLLVQLQHMTASYLELVKRRQHSLDELAEPLPLFGQLVALKARVLLPQPAQPDDEQDEPVSLEDLKARLAEYERFKTVAQVLAELHALQHEHLTRDQSLELDAAQDEAADMPAGAVQVGITDLMTAFGHVLEKAKAPVYEVQTEPWTVEMKVEELTMLLTIKRTLQFHELFAPDKSKLELVVTFLALLELIRQRLCLAVQSYQFGEILVVRRDPTATA